MKPDQQEQAFKLVIDAFAAARAEESKEWPQLFTTFAGAFKDSREARALQTPYLNILDVFGLKLRELCHSRVLEWFLNENATHEQGPLFFKSLAKLLGLIPMSCENYQVQRERPERVDIAAFKSGDFAVFIENKVEHHEREEQMEDLIKALISYGEKNTIPESKRFAIFLTDDGRPPTTSPDVMPMGFRNTNLLSIKRTSLFAQFLADVSEISNKSARLMVFLESYLDSISQHPGTRL